MPEVCVILGENVPEFPTDFINQKFIFFLKTVILFLCGKCYINAKGDFLQFLPFLPILPFPAFASMANKQTATFLFNFLIIFVLQKKAESARQEFP